MEKITFRFERDPEYRVITANGAWGGITPRGELMFDLFFEHMEMPEEISYLSTPDGLGPEVARTPTPAVLRDALVGVVMTPENAENFGRWILEKVGMVRKRPSQSNAPPSNPGESSQ